ncbi:e235a1c9-d43a-4d0b-bc80-6a67df701b94-CDS [Sclerotinia trifoliorum]|uniref:E235a1c9-d43a-4d0b-bc80-6a67df701b94-CDS n=1 Tax=Sclerotinia trifoliorum TaxID=28548 RepID=A0A8H2ZU27_9HELO|nr:e235a1c9-d43a-4d0b-bc80-6a67df701b94-CDS [Sclerotinia trifoliorum]
MAPTKDDVEAVTSRNTFATCCTFLRPKPFYLNLPSELADFFEAINRNTFAVMNSLTLASFYTDIPYIIQITAVDEEGNRKQAQFFTRRKLGPHERADTNCYLHLIPLFGVHCDIRVDDVEEAIYQRRNYIMGETFHWECGGTHRPNQEGRSGIVEYEVVLWTLGPRITALQEAFQVKRDTGIMPPVPEWLRREIEADIPSGED